MHDKRDDYEPIIADRRSREPLREEAQPLWRLVLALGAGVLVIAVLVWWFMGRSASDDAGTNVSSEGAALEMRPEEHIEQEAIPSARDAETNTDVPRTSAPAAPVAEPEAGAEQSAAPAEVPAVDPDDAVQAPVPPAPVSVRFTSPDAQAGIELRPLDSSSPLTSKPGEVISVAPGPYLAVVSGAELETFKQEVMFDSAQSYEYTVELCAVRKQERESLVGRVIEERACASTAECESMFMVLSEQAEQLVKNRALRAQQCAKWRDNAAPEGLWRLDVNCGGATLATTCRVEIAEGACMLTAPRRSVRGAACPRVQLKSRG